MLLANYLVAERLCEVRAWIHAFMCACVTFSVSSPAITHRPPTHTHTQPPNPTPTTPDDGPTRIHPAAPAPGPARRRGAGAADQGPGLQGLRHGQLRRPPGGAATAGGAGREPKHHSVRLCALRGMRICLYSSRSIRLLALTRPPPTPPPYPPPTRAIVCLCTHPMRPAEYLAAGSMDSEIHWRHYALNIPYYTHFTSPIRRCVRIKAWGRFGVFVSTSTGSRRLIHPTDLTPRPPPDTFPTATRTCWCIGC